MKKANRKINGATSYAILIFVSLCLAGCATAPVKEAKKKLPPPLDSAPLDKESITPARVPRKKLPLRLDSISLDKKSFKPDSGEFVNIHYKPSKPCSATITICDSRGVPFKVLANSKPTSPIAENIVWDGLDENDIAVPGGVYFYVVELKDEDTSYIYNPYNRSHGIPLRSVTGFYDQEKGEIHYTVPQAARVRIRVGLKDGGPLLITPLDWTEKVVGKYLVKWDGKDASGHIYLSSHPDRNLVIFAYTLADNSIIVKSDIKAVLNRDLNVPALFSPDLPRDRDIHARNYLRMPNEPRIDVKFQGGFEKTENGIPIIKGMVPVKVSIAPEDRLALENSRYEIMFYVDTVFLFEEESGFSPFTYMWDTRGLSEGEHLLTVNLWSYDDDCGVITKKVFVQKDK